MFTYHHSLLVEQLKPRQTEKLPSTLIFQPPATFFSRWRLKLTAPPIPQRSKDFLNGVGGRLTVASGDPENQLFSGNACLY